MGSRLANLSSQEACQRAFLKVKFAISCQTSQEENNFKGKIGNFLPDPRQELSGGFPESNFKCTICNFLPDPGQQLSGGLPESNFKGKICNFLPDPGQELSGGFPDSK